jgi:hypothetical protein
MATLWPHVAKRKEASMYSPPPSTPPKPSLLRLGAMFLITIVGFAAGRGSFAGLTALGLSLNAAIGVLALLLLTIGLVVWLYRRRRSPR